MGGRPPTENMRDEPVKVRGYTGAVRVAFSRAHGPGEDAAGPLPLDADTPVRHRLPVVMICGNNGVRGREKYALRLLYGYGVAADLQPQCHDEVVRVPGGVGELMTAPAEPGQAPRRAAASSVTYPVNVATDPEVVYQRSTTGV